MGSDSDSEYDPEEEAAALSVPPPPSGAPPSAGVEEEMYDPFADSAPAGSEVDDAGYCFEEEDEEDDEQVQQREQAVLLMKQRDLKLSLEAKEVQFPSRDSFGFYG